MQKHPDNITNMFRGRTIGAAFDPLFDGAIWYKQWEPFPAIISSYGCVISGYRPTNNKAVYTTTRGTIY